MQVPVKITFRNVEKTPAVEDLINRKVDKLERICNYITSCRITIEKLQKHQRMGNLFRVQIDLAVPPGHKLVAGKEPGDSDMHDPLFTVVRHAFEAAERQLKALVERQRGLVKTHQEQELQAVVSRLYKDESHGSLRTIEGREIYFHKNSVLNHDFDRLEIGTGVRYVYEIGERGPQASTVQIVDKPGVRVRLVEVGKT